MARNGAKYAGGCARSQQGMRLSDRKTQRLCLHGAVVGGDTGPDGSLTSQRQAMATSKKRGRPRDPNRRLLARLRSDDLDGLEDGYVAQHVRLGSPLIKRLYLRHFDSYQRAVRTVQVVARTELGDDTARAAEDVLRQQLEELERYFDTKARECDALLEANGAKGLRSDHLAPLAIEARLLSPMARRMLASLCKADDILTRLNALVIVDIVSPDYGDRVSYEVRKAIRRTVAGAVHAAVQTWRAVKRKRADADLAKSAEPTAPAPASQEPSAAASAEAQAEQAAVA